MVAHDCDPTLEKVRQEVHKLKACLGCTASSTPPPPPFPIVSQEKVMRY